jgi:Na+/H+ antiporter NhaD/arsenite permease-like protein
VRQLIAGSIFVLAYVLIATEWVHRVIVALAGAGLMLLFRFVDANEAFQNKELGIDWNVIFLLLGMMAIVAIVRQTGLFEYLAIWSAKRARGRPYRVMVMLTVITAVASALLDNVTTVLLVAPVTVLIAERLGVPVVPLLMAQIMASNIGGTATLIGDPPNIIIGSQAGLSYLDFLRNLAPIVVILLLVFLLVFRLLFRSQFRHRPERVSEIMALNEREALRDRPLIARSLAVLAVVTIAFALHSVLHYDPSIVSLLGAGTLMLISRIDPGPVVEGIEWPTLAFFMGLFVMVGALVKVGVIERMADATLSLTGGSTLVATLLLVWVSGALSGLVDNVPYVAAMAPLVRDLQPSLSGETTALWWALALGANLGGNATIIGASANIVVVGIAERAGHRIGFVDFFRYGSLVAALTLVVASLYLWGRYFLLA